MGWDLTQWVAFARSAQIVGSLVAVGSHGYFTIRVKNSAHGVTKEITVLAMMVFSQFLDNPLSYQRTDSIT
jgi:phage-related holin